MQVCYNFISFFILKVVVECSKEIFKNLLSLNIYLYDNSRESDPWQQLELAFEVESDL